ncbi:MAG: ATP-dependent Clp protease proteolytic subunit [Chloroflexi bacterium]|nr:ATP-dependent Clp protease proteolytic subunit [Chloroflexota bacterium]
MVLLSEELRDYRARRQEMDRQGAYFLGAITEEEAEKFSKTLLVMATERAGRPQEPIRVFVTSGGGSMGAGFAIIEMMNRMRTEYDVRILTIVNGYAYSMGAIIFQAGDRRVMGPYSTMMLHGAAWAVTGQDNQVFRDLAKLSRMYRTLVGELFAQRTGRQDARWWERYIYSGRDKYLSAQECLRLGLADEVTERVAWRPT